jgi:hypothetical protein
MAMAVSLERRIARLKRHPCLQRLVRAEDTAELRRAWEGKVRAWLVRLAESMDEAHCGLVTAWAEDYRYPCRHAPCPVPPGLRKTLDILFGWIDCPERPVALPPAMVEVYLAGTPATMPHHDCEDCGYPVPVTGFFAASSIYHFPLCPLCKGVTGWHAWDIKHDSPGYRGLTPYGER